MSQHSSWRIGGPTDFFLEAFDSEELVSALRFAEANHIPRLIIGQGTNLLFADEGYRGLVIKIGPAFGGLRIEGEEIEAQAGVQACWLARASCRAGLSGIEHIVGIPGTLGGLIVMNGGSLRKSIGENILWVGVLAQDGGVQRLSVSTCGFAYRTSRFQSEDQIILSARLRLASRPSSEIRREMLRILRDRRHKFPRKLPNCGSVFKSSPELFASAGPPGKIIEDCGFKGRRIGDAAVSPLHANFIVNCGQATAADTLQLIQRIRNEVHQRHGVWMEAEAKYVGSDGRVVAAHEAPLVN